MIKHFITYFFRALLALVFLGTSFTYATLYPKEMKFQHILENRDIVVGEVRAILQDSQGFMWFGGWESLVRYDGYDVKPILNKAMEAGEEVLVPTTMTTVFFEDSKNNIWVGTAQGLFRFYPEKNEIVRLPHDKTQPIPISKSHIVGIAEAPSGEILAAALDGLYVVNPR